MEGERRGEMSEDEKARVEVGGGSVNVTGEKGEKVHVGPGGVYVKDKDSEVRVNWTGVRVRDGETNIDVSFWKPLVCCGVAAIVFIAILTAVVVGIAKYMM